MFLYFLIFLMSANDFIGINVKDVPKRTRPPRTPTPTFNQTNARISGSVIIPVIVIASIAMCIYFFWELKHPGACKKEIETPLLDHGSSVPVSAATANQSQILPNSSTLGIHKDSKAQFEPFLDSEEEESKVSSRHEHHTGRRHSHHEHDLDSQRTSRSNHDDNGEKKHSSRSHKSSRGHEITHNKSHHKIETKELETKTMPIFSLENSPGPSLLVPPAALPSNNVAKSARKPKNNDKDYSYSDYYYSDYDYYSGYYSDYTDGSDGTIPKLQDFSDDSSSSSSMISLAKITMPFL